MHRVEIRFRHQWKVPMRSSGCASGLARYGDGSGLYEDGEQAEDPLQTAMAEESGQSSEVFGKAERPGDSVSFKPPGDVGSGHDDDIIARQLREAAEKEQDPELRAKLWDEYRKYKKGSS